MKLSARINRATSKSARVAVLCAFGREQEQKAAHQAYLETLTLPELVELRQAVLWRDAQANPLLENLTADELLDRYRFKMANGQSLS